MNTRAINTVISFMSSMGGLYRVQADEADAELVQILETNHQLIESVANLRASISAARELLETVRANHDWTERRNAWLDGKKDELWIQSEEIE